MGPPPWGQSQAESSLARLAARLRLGSASVWAFFGSILALISAGFLGLISAWFRLGFRFRFWFDLIFNGFWFWFGFDFDLILIRFRLHFDLIWLHLDLISGWISVWFDSDSVWFRMDSVWFQVDSNSKSFRRSLGGPWDLPGLPKILVLHSWIS